MDKIEVVVLHESHPKPANMMMFGATLTQRGHLFKSADDLKNYYDACMDKDYKSAASVAKLPHGTIKRNATVTLAIVGASRRFLAQIRTHAVGLTFISASLQYSNYSDDAAFVVPYELIKADPEVKAEYIKKCQQDTEFYRYLMEQGIDNDSAGYAMNQALRNVLVITGNYESWYNLIKVRSCKRNTKETQYVATLIWEALLGTAQGEIFFKDAGPGCVGAKCPEGRFCCGKPVFPKYLTERYNTENPAVAYKLSEFPNLFMEEM